VLRAAMFGAPVPMPLLAVPITSEHSLLANA
jgi:hypothetical protein